MSQLLRSDDAISAIGTLTTLPKAVAATSAFEEPEPVRPPQPVRASLPASVAQAQLEAAIAVNRSNTSPDVVEQRTAPRYSLREINSLSPEEISDRLSQVSAGDDRPGWVKVLDIIDMPRNFMQNIITENFAPEAKRMALERGEFDQAGQVKVYGSDILRSMGIKNQVVNAIGGFFVDVFTDPLSFIGGPLGGLKSVGTRGATQLSVKGRRTLNSSINALRQGKPIADGNAARLLTTVVEDGIERGLLKETADNATRAAFARDALLGTSGKISNTAERFGLGKFTKGGYLSDDLFSVAKDLDGNLRPGYTATQAARIDSVKDFVAKNSNNGLFNFTRGKGGAEILHVPFMPSTTVTIPAFNIPTTSARFGRAAELQIAAAAVRKGNPAQAQAIIDSIAHVTKVKNLANGLENTAMQLRGSVDDIGAVRYEALKARQADLAKRLGEAKQEAEAFRGRSLGHFKDVRASTNDLPTLFATMDLYDEAAIKARHAETAARWSDESIFVGGIDNVARVTGEDLTSARKSRQLLGEAAQAQFKIDPEKFLDALLDPAKQAEGFDDLVEAHIEHAGRRYKQLITASEDDLARLDKVVDAYQEHVAASHMVSKLYQVSIRGALENDAALLSDAAAMMLRVSDPDLGHLPGMSFARFAESLGMHGLASRMRDISARTAVNLGGVKGLVPDTMRHVRAQFSNAKHAMAETADRMRIGIEEAMRQTDTVSRADYDRIAELMGMRLEQKMIAHAQSNLVGDDVAMADRLFVATAKSRETLLQAQKSGVFRDKQFMAKIDEIVDEAANDMIRIGDEAIRRGDFDNPVVAYMPVMLKREAARRANIARSNKGLRTAAEELLDEAGGPMTFDPTKRRITNIVEFTPKGSDETYRFTVAEGAAYAAKSEGEILAMGAAEQANARYVQEGVKAFRAQFGTRAKGEKFVDAMQARARPMTPFEANQYAENGRLDAIVGGVIGMGKNRRDFFETNMVNLVYNRLAAHEILRVKESLRDLVDEFVVARIGANDVQKTTYGAKATLATGEEATFLGDGRIRVGNRDYVQLASIQKQFAPDSIFDPVRLLGEDSHEMFIPDTLATEMMRLADTLRPEPMGEIMQMAERVTSLFRTTTLLHPSWAVTNTIGNTILAAMGGAMSDPKRAAKFFKYMGIAAKAHFRRNADEASRLKFIGRGINRAGTTFGDNLDKTFMLGGGPITRREVLRLADENQVTGAGRSADALEAMMLQNSRDLPGLADDVAETGIRATAQRIRDRRRAGRVSSKLANAVDIPYGIAAAAPTDLYRRSVNTWFQANATIDDIFRTAFFMQLLDDGVDPITAGARTRRHMLNFGDMSSFERNNIRPLVPFYAWMRASLPSFVVRGIKDPKLLSAVPKLQNGLEELLAGEDRLPRHMRPRWLQETMGIQLGTDPETRKAVLAGTLLPQEGAFQAATALGGLGASIFDPDGSTAGFDGHDFMEGVNWLFGQTSPAFRVPVELASGREIFSKRDIGVEQGEGDITLQDYLLNQVRPIKEYGLGLRQGEIAEAAEEQGAGAAAARLLLGGRIQRGLQEDRRRTSIYFEWKAQDDKLRKAIRLAEKNGDDERVVKLKLRMLQEAKVYLDRGGSPDELPKWLRDDLSGYGGLPNT
jgi:hypothetical protein